MGAERWDEQVGSVADEATRLLESLRRSAAEAAANGTAESSDGPPPASADEPAPAAPPRPDDVEPDAAAHDPACQWCPLCRGAAVVRSLSPQTLTRLADLAGLAATVLSELASTRGATDGSATGPAADADAPPARPRSGRPIPVTDADPREAPRA